MRIEECFSESTPRKTIKAGDAIFKEGEIGEHMYVLLEGIVDIRVGNNLIGSFEAVEVLGEMAVIDPGPRSATILAQTDCQLISVNQRKFMILTEHNPEFALFVMRILVERMRWLNQAAEAASAKNTAASGRPAELFSESESGHATSLAEDREVTLTR